MSLVSAIIGFLCGAFLEGVAGALFGGVLGFTLARVIKLSSETKVLEKELAQLRATLAKDWELRHASRFSTSSAGEKGEVAKPETDQGSLKGEHFDEPASMTQSKVEEPASPASEIPEATAASQKSEPLYSLPSSSSAVLDSLTARIKGYFTEGNLFVRIGILVLFFGVGFLLKYAAEHSVFPTELRLVGVAAGGIILLVVGWRLREKRDIYALILQGGGVGILYLTVFASFQLYHLLPTSLAFLLLVLIGLLCSVLSILQNACSMAVMGMVGGFLAPILASTGSGNHIALFSYYTVLNSGILAIAWFRSWRILNLLGFGFTFIIGTLWGVTRYRPELFDSTEPFLILFFIFYTAIAVLFAIRQPPKLKGYVDATLVFGNPLIAFGLQVVLVRRIEYGVALSAFVLGAFYLVLAMTLWRHAKEGLKTLSEAFLALAVVFTSLAIPFAIDGQWTAAAWALEGAGILWVGVRQNRPLARAFALLLQVGAGVVFFARSADATGDWLFLNSAYIGSAMVAFAGSLSAYFLYQTFKDRKSWEISLSPVLLVWGLLWWFTGAFHQFQVHLDKDYLNTALLFYVTLMCACFGHLAARLKWSQARYAGLGLLPGMAIIVVMTLEAHSHPAAFAGYIAWPLAFVTYYWLLWRCDKEAPVLGYLPILHAGSGLLLVILISWEGGWRLREWFPQRSAWTVAFWPVVPVLALMLLLRGRFWPLTKHRKTYLSLVGRVLVICFISWSLMSALSSADATPLPTIPLLNPVDIMQVFGLIIGLQWWLALRRQQAITTQQNRYVWMIAAAIAFIWINAMLLRTLHHWAHIPYLAEAMFESFLVQASISILWTLIGMAVMVLAARRAWRRLWFAGSGLLGMVVVKLFVVDLAASGTIERIVSFLVVGVLLVLIGYFSPLPPYIAQSEGNRSNP